MLIKMYHYQNQQGSSTPDPLLSSSLNAAISCPQDLGMEEKKRIRNAKTEDLICIAMQI